MKTAPWSPSGMTGQWGTVAGMVGTGWRHHLRIMHPAMRRDGEEWLAVPWGQLATPGTDLSVASWFDVTGIRPHLGRPVPGIDLEPVEAEGAGPLIASVLRILDHVDTLVYIGQWTGYGAPPADWPGEAHVVDTPKRSYLVRRLTMGELIGRLSGVGNQVEADLIPNVVWRADHWCLASDTDTMSTYLGAHDLPNEVSTALTSARIEWTRVNPDDPVS